MLDTAQICIKGHIVNEAFHHATDSRRDFCTECGEKTITACPQCHRDIPGMFYDVQGNFASMGKTPPDHCGSCGAAFPWNTRFRRLGRLLPSKEKLAALHISIQAALAKPIVQLILSVLLALLVALYPVKLLAIVLWVVVVYFFWSEGWLRSFFKAVGVIGLVTVLVLAVYLGGVRLQQRSAVITQNTPVQTRPQALPDQTTNDSVVKKQDISQKSDDKAEKTPATSLSKLRPKNARKVTVGKQAEPAKLDGDKPQTPQTLNNAPNGIAISGGTVTNPTVTNNNGLFPPPGQTPTISICFVSQNVPKSDNYETVFTLDTSVPISSPWWLFQFDSPVVKLVPLMEQGHPFIYSSDHPNPKTITDSEKAIALNVDTSFFGSQRPWRPGDKITATLTSHQPVKLVGIFGGSAASATGGTILEHYAYPCGQ